MGFVHGEVSWLEPATSLSAAVDAMLAAADAPCWAASTLVGRRSPSASCVLAVQADRPTARGTATTSGLDGFDLVTDLRLTDRATLADRLAARSDAPSDDGLVRRAFHRWGVDCADRIDGEGTFALWDAVEGASSAGATPPGTRPLYYHHAPGRGIVLSSDLRSLVAHPRIAATLDLRYLRTLLERRMAYRPASRTMVQGSGSSRPATHSSSTERGSASGATSAPPISRPSATATTASTSSTCGACCTTRSPTGSRPTNRSRRRAPQRRARLVEPRGHDSAITPRGQRLTGFSWAPPWSVVPEVDGDERPLAEAAATFASIPLRFTDLRP
jgi:hypothetical protein